MGDEEVRAVGKVTDVCHIVWMGENHVAPGGKPMETNIHWYLQGSLQGFFSAAGVRSCT